MRRISKQTLKDLDACADQRRIFAQMLGSRSYLYPTVNNLREAHHKGLDLRWAIHMGLIPQQDDVRDLFCSLSPYYAVSYAQYVDEGPHPSTRDAACHPMEGEEVSLECALRYAHYVDEGSHPQTRAICLQNPKYATYYATLVDRGPADDTREAASKSGDWAFRYACEVDKGPHPVTREGAYASTWSRRQYEKEFDTKPETTAKTFTSQSGPIITVTCTHKPHTHNTPA